MKKDFIRVLSAMLVFSGLNLFNKIYAQGFHFSLMGKKILEKQLLQSADNSNVAKVKSLFKELSEKYKFYYEIDKDNHLIRIINFVYGNENTVLHWAAKIGHAKMVQALIDSGEFIDVKNSDNITPLFVAIEEGNIEIVKLLIKNGAHLNCEDCLGRAVLSESGNDFITNLLIRVKYLDENITKISLNELSLSDDEKTIMVKRFINKNVEPYSKIKLLEIAFEILKTLNKKQLSQLFEQREIISLIKSYRNQKIYNLLLIKNFISLSQNYISKELKELIYKADMRYRKDCEYKDSAHQHFFDVSIITKH